MPKKKPLPEVHVGDRVVWTSQANGGAREKKGTVICMIDPGRKPSEVVNRAIENGTIPSPIRSTLDPRSLSRKEMTPIVRVDYPGTRKTPCLYAPLLRNLRVLCQPGDPHKK